MKNHKRNIFFNLLLVVLIVIACLVIAEIGSRIYLFASGKGGYILIPDDYLGRVHAPNSRFIYEEDFSKEFKVRRKTNSLGLIGEDISVRKPEGVFRILVLGDSFTEALQVQESENFCEQLQDRLNRATIFEAMDYEVLNAGVSGYSPISEYLYFKRELMKLNPDLVILQLFANDVFEDNKVGAMSVLDETGLPLKINRFFIKEYVENPSRVFKSELCYGLKKFILGKSRFAQVIVRAVRKTYKRSSIHKEMVSSPRFNDANQFFIIQGSNPLFRDRDFRESAWKKTEKYALAIKKLAEDNKAEFVIMIIPPEAQLRLKEYGLNTEMYFSRNKANFYLNSLLKKLSGKHGIYYLDLYSQFRKNKNQKLYFDRDGHLTKRGHKLTSEAIFDFLIQNSLIK